MESKKYFAYVANKVSDPHTTSDNLYNFFLKDFRLLFAVYSYFGPKKKHVSPVFLNNLVLIDSCISVLLFKLFFPQNSFTSHRDDGKVRLLYPFPLFLSLIHHTVLTYKLFVRLLPKRSLNQQNGVCFSHSPCLLYVYLSANKPSHPSLSKLRRMILIRYKQHLAVTCVIWWEFNIHIEIWYTVRTTCTQIEQSMHRRMNEQMIFIAQYSYLQFSHDIDIFELDQRRKRILNPVQ